MTSSACNPVEEKHDLNQLRILLEQKENEISFLKDKYGQLPSSLIQHIDKSLQPIHSALQEKINLLETTHHKLLAECEDLFFMLHSVSTNIKQDYQRTFSHLEEVNEARQQIIKTQQRALNAFRLATLKAKIKHFFRPRIGILYQYEAQPLNLPTHYHKAILLDKIPTISIVTPSYNQAEFIERTILSVLNQAYPQLEYIIQDGGSTDTSTDIIKSYASSLKHWESKKDNGQSHALNLGFQHAKGEIMAYLNSDDLLLPGTLNYVARYFNQHPDVDVVYGHRVVINSDDNEIGRWVLPQHDSEVLEWADYIPQETLFWRRSLWEKVGGNIDETFRFAMDWDLILRFKNVNAKFMRLPRFLGAFRAHEQQKTSSQISEVGEQEMKRLRKRCHGRQVTHREIIKHIRSYQIRHVIYNKLYRLGILRY